MYKVISFNDFVNEFESYGRKNNFSIPALREIYSFLEETACECNNLGAELDVIAICCSFSEYEDQESLEEYYDLNLDEIMEDYLVLETEIGTFVVIN